MSASERVSDTPGGPVRTALTLGGVLIGFLVVPMAMSGTSVALPEISAELGGSGAALQWVVTGYFLAATCLMLVAGSLGDRVGRRLVFAAGVVVWTLSTLGAALSGDVLLLDTARTLSGVGAAAVLACGGAILASTFTGPARTRAFGAVGAVVGTGLAFGPTVAGWLVGTFGWRAMFAVFAAAGLVVLAGTPAMRESTASVRPRFDLTGTLLFVTGMVGLMFGVNRVSQAGWGDPVVLASAGVGALLLVAFAVVQRRVADPVLDLGLVGDRRFVGWLLAAVTLAFGTVGVLVYLPTWLQGAGGLSAQEAGALMLVMTVPVLLVPPLAGQVVARGVPARVVVGIAVGCLAAGNAWLVGLSPGGAVLTLAGPLLLLGLGNGAAVGLIDAQALDLVDADRVGMASGLLNTMRSAANTVALAVFGAVLVTVVQAGTGDRELAGRVALGDLSGGDAGYLAEQYTAAWRVGLGLVAGLCVLAGAAVLYLTSRARPAVVPTEEESHL
ncbi:MFS transporter [Pseudonocardia nematodicida]|uniref:MFS transporter n=1 Tax=Pseudonocardia nematodicida TaxID=1206997 RepID=A0ABV1KFY2_9PSEU